MLIKKKIKIKEKIKVIKSNKNDIFLFYYNKNIKMNNIIKITKFI